MKVEVITPEQYMGDVTGDLNRRRGILEGMDSRAGAQVIKAKVPLSEMFGYVTQLRSLSSGRATSTMEFSHYSPAPSGVAEEVIAKELAEAGADVAGRLRHPRRLRRRLLLQCRGHLFPRPRQAAQGSLGRERTTTA